MRHLVVAIATAALLVSSSGTAIADEGSAGRIYDSIERAGNVPSQPFEAQQASEFGDRVTFAGTARELERVTVSLSSWGCELGHWYDATCVTRPGTGFTHPITLNIYAGGSGASAGTLIATRTRTFMIPFRPSSDTVRCTEGRWYDGASKTCFNGLQTFITFDLEDEHVTVPDTIVWSVAYNTSHYGYQPIGESAACYTSSAGCGYDSLNVGLGAKVNRGSKPNPDTAFINSATPSVYCDKGAAGSGSFRLDSPTVACWAGYVPAASFTASRGEHADGDDEHESERDD